MTTNTTIPTGTIQVPNGNCHQNYHGKFKLNFTIYIEEFNVLLGPTDSLNPLHYIEVIIIIVEHEMTHLIIINHNIGITYVEYRQSHITLL